MDKAAWPDLKAKVAESFKSKTRDEWDEIMLGTDICYAPVLDMDEAFDHPHNRERDTITEAFGIKQPNVAPRFSGTPKVKYKGRRRKSASTMTRHLPIGGLMAMCWKA